MNYFLVFDTSSFIRLSRNTTKLNELKKRFQSFQIVIPKQVQLEIKDFASKYFLEGFGDLITVIEPSKKYVKSVVEKAKFYGGRKILSEADIEVLALALELIRTHGENVLIFSEDYDIQNLAETLGIPYDSIQQRKIKKILGFYKKCKACGKVYEAEKESCPDCGSTEFKIVAKRFKKL